MSASQSVNATTCEPPAKQIESFLLDNLDDAFGYFKSRDIAQSTGLETKLVGTLISDIDEQSTELSISQWAKTNCVTWRVEKVGTE